MFANQQIAQTSISFHQPDLDANFTGALMEAEMPGKGLDQREAKAAMEGNDLAREEASETFYKIETQFKKIAAR